MSLKTLESNTYAQSIIYKVEKMKYSILILFASILLYSCDPSKKAVLTAPVVEFEDLDTLVVSAPRLEPGQSAYNLPKYNPSFSRTQDLIHTKLDLKFNWEKQQVIGNAFLTLRPFFYPTDVLTLDAKGFKIHKVALNGKELKYDYNGLQLNIELGKLYEAGSEYIVNIQYDAFPTKTETHTGEAILSDQGLFFINPDGTEGNKPKQIWTQGETENNSKWFPTIDKPNERCTQELTLTVEDKYKTLSNGLLISSKKNSDGTRTDYWKMDQPHAPYLFMLAVGDFAKVTEQWRGIDIDYYVEPEYEADAKAIFSNTLEMLDFFSDFTGVDYPWQKYAQIIVRDYVSGAMENTTGVIFGEFVQKNKRELIDNHNERIVAHEMIHHWFGDLVTCESWANLTMNEGFANYGEYLWFEHKYGKDEADHHMMGEMNGYIQSSKEGMHPLIHFSYDDKELMFDAHSYNKGGLVLHMLRNYIGDKAFKASLKKYLTDNAYTAVEAHDLRLAVEDVTGQDMNWFFNQWYFSAGHPILEITHDYDAISKEAIVKIEQKQSPELGPAIFQLPITVDIYTGTGQPRRENIMMTERKQTFRFAAGQKPELVNVDAENVLLAEKIEKKSNAEFAFEYKNAGKFKDRIEGLAGLAKTSSTEKDEIIKAALSDKHWSIRSEAVQGSTLTDAGALATLESLAVNDPHSQVRAMALRKLAGTGDKKYVDIAKKVVSNEQSYRVIGAGLEVIRDLDPAQALEYARKLENEKNGNIINTIGGIYAQTGDVKYLSFFENGFDKVDGYDALSFFENYVALNKRAEDSVASKSLDKMKSIAINMKESPWKRFAATKSLNDMRVSFVERAGGMEGDGKAKLMTFVDDISAMINEIKAVEKNDQLKMFYNSF